MTDKFCKFCGAAHTATAFPLKCGSCETITWFSPSPVAVILQSVEGPDGRFGVLIGRRTIEPGKGQWALPGGFVDATDLTAQAAAARELFEETGFTVEDPDAMSISHTFSDGRHFLIFVENMNAMSEEDVKAKFVPNSECDEVRVAYEPVDLCFPAHTEALRLSLEINEIAAGLFGSMGDEDDFDARHYDDRDDREQYGRTIDDDLDDDWRR